MGDYWVTVCAACLCASCWHGEFMCQQSRDADTAERRASELRTLKREHRHHYSRKKLREVTGCEPIAATPPTATPGEPT